MPNLINLARSPPTLDEKRGWSHIPKAYQMFDINATQSNKKDSPIFDSNVERVRQLEKQAVFDAEKFVADRNRLNKLNGIASPVSLFTEVVIDSNSRLSSDLQDASDTATWKSENAIRLREKNALLGKDANKVAKTNKIEKFGNFRRLAFAQKVLFENDVLSPQSGKIHRTRLCQSCRQFNAEKIGINISSNPEKQKASFSGLQSCSNIWGCPVCAPRIAMQRGKEITYANDKMMKLGFAPIMMTLTARHSFGTPLRWQKEQFKKAWDKLKRDGSYKRLMKKLGIDHRINSREVTWGFLNGWHYHMHLLMYIPVDVLKQLADTDLEDWVDKLKRRWLACLDAKKLDGDYEHALNVKADGNVKASYLAKLGLTDETTNTNFELTAGRNKDGKGRNIWSILRNASEGDEHSEALYLEYFRAMTGDKWITWSNGLKDLVGLKEMSDEEAASSDEEVGAMEHLMDIDDYEYMPVRKLRAYADLLELASVSRSEEVVREWLVKLMFTYQSAQAIKDRKRQLEQKAAIEAKIERFMKSPMKIKDPIYDPGYVADWHRQLRSLNRALGVEHSH